MPSAFVMFNVTHEAHRCNRHGCFDTCSKEEKDQQIHLQQSVRIHASPGTSLRIWGLMCWCNGTSHSRLFLRLSEKKSISPRQVSIHHTGQVQGPEPSGLEDTSGTRSPDESSPAWELYGSAVGTLHPWRKPGYSTRNPPKFVIFSSPILKSILTCIQAPLGGTRVVKWGIHRRTMRSVSAHVCMHVCLRHGCGGSVTRCGIHSESF